jgi:hypothetical protein
MKKVYLILVVIGSIVFSCNRFEEGPHISLKTPESRLDGEWQLVASFSEGAEDAYDKDVYNYDGDLVFKFEKESDENGYGAFSYVSGAEDKGLFVFGESGYWKMYKFLTGRNGNIDFLYFNWGATDEMNVVRLTSKELWIENDGKVLHFEKVK